MKGPATMVATLRDADRPVIGVGSAAGTWAFGWGVGSVIAAPLVIVLLGASLGDDLTIPQLAAASVATWAVMAAALVGASRRFGTGDALDDYAARFRPIDLVGVPLGVATQFLFIPWLYLPLQAIWPSTFSDERIEERAQELADKAGGWATVLLVLVVVVGAPIIEEFVYRGLLQRSASTVLGAGLALVSTSAWFALVHFSPVEYPGLFLAGLVFGGCVVIAGRIGPAIVTHAAFNAAGLVVVLDSAG
ncbi:CPBP family intramembrane glutamic endopeptidase [Ilumatobacter sp.]|uniref:CPBP family intramembrane glutamic endopeptidase n=1 Tax=Ilumatobacter sp. TaxID=1967498 RepID=UPI003AF91EF6